MPMITKHELGGVYRLKVSSAKPGTSSGGHPQAELEFAVVDAPHKGDIGAIFRFQNFILDNVMSVNRFIDLLGAINGQDEVKPGTSVDTDSPSFYANLLEGEFVANMVKKYYGTEGKFGYNIAEVWPVSQYEEQVRKQQEIEASPF